MRRIAFLFLLIFSGFSSLHAQYSINTVNTPQVIDFQSFDGLGLRGIPNNELNSNEWKVYMTTQGYTTFGADYTTGLYANGKTPGPVSDTGLYAFETTGAPINVAVGAKLNAIVDTISLTLQIENNTGRSINTLEIGFDWGTLNSGDGSVKGSFYYSSDDVAYNPSGIENFSAAALNPTPTWSSLSQSITLNNLNLAPSDVYYLRWEFTKESPAGGVEYDEVSLDNIVLKATVPVVSIVTAAVSELESNDLQVTVHCENSDNNETRVALDLLPGATATQGTDFLYAFADTVRFQGVNAPDFTITIPVTDDLISEPDETFTLKLNDINNFGIIDDLKDTVELTIIDNDKILVEFETISSTQGESNIVHTIVGRALNNIDSTTVQIDLIGGTATDGVDYTWAGQILGNKFVFVGTGNLTDTLEVTISDDALSEGDETVRFQLSNPDNGLGQSVDVNSANGEHELTIVDDEVPFVRFTASLIPVSETVGSINVSLERIDANPTVSSITVALLGTGTATDGVDFVFGAEKVISFSGGEGEIQNVNIPIIDDALIEGNEEFILYLKDPVNTNFSNDNDTILIIDEDSPEMNFRDFSVAKVEGNLAELVVELQAAHPTMDVSCDVRSIGGTATPDVDYTDIFPRTITFPAGDNTPISVFVLLTDDAIIEDTEFINVELANPVNGNLGIDKRASIDILDNDNPVLEFAVIDQNVFEGDGSVKVAVHLDQAHPLEDVEVDVVLVGGGSATEGADYNYPVSQRVTFPAGDNTPKQLLIPILEDQLPEPTEAFTLRLENATSNAVIGPKQTHSISIFDNDQTQISFAVVADDVSEDIGQVDLAIEVINPSSGTPTSVKVVLGNGSATAGQDFYFANQVITWPAGNGDPKVITVPVIDDGLREGTELAIFELEDASSNAVIGERRFTLTIRDNDTSKVQFTPLSQVYSEDDPRMLVSVELLNPSPNLNTDVDVRWAGGTAIEGEDFVYPNTQRVRFFAGGSSIQTLAIPIIDDADYEGVEWLEMILEPLDSDVIFIGGNQRDTILDNETDPIPVLSFEATAVGVDEGAGFLDVDIQISTLFQDTVGVDVRLLPGTATEGVDFDFPTTQHVVFPRASDANQVIRIPITEDFIQEPTEHFRLELINPTNTAVLSSNSDTLMEISIQDNDTLQGAYVTFEMGEVEYDEAAGNPVLNLMMVDEGTCIVSTNVIEETATNILDFSGAEHVFVFQGDSVPQAFPLFTIVDDVIGEPTESFLIAFDVISGPCVAGPYDTLRVNIKDNDSGSGMQFQFDQFVATESEDTLRLAVVVDTTNYLGCEVDVSVVPLESTATIGVDYEYPATQRMVFNTLQDTAQFFDLVLHDDLDLEGSEYVKLILENAGGTLGCIIGDRDTLLVEIQDDEVPLKEYTIDDINNLDAFGFADSVGVECYLTGIVHGYNLEETSYRFFLLDGTGGILVDGPFVSGYDTVTAGDEIEVFGTVGEFNGMLLFEPISITHLDTLQALETAMEVDTLVEMHQGLPVIFNCLELVNPNDWNPTSGNWSVEVTNGTHVFELHLDSSAAYDYSITPEGKFNVHGFVLQDDNTLPYDGNYEIVLMEADALEEIIDVDFTFVITDDFGDFEAFSDGAVSYFWDMGDGVGTDSTIKVGYTFSDPGFYLVTLTVTDENGCTVSITKEIEIEEPIIVIGIEETQGALSDIRMYPNPTQGTVYFSKELAQIQVFSIDGKQVKLGTGNTLHLKGLHSGVYLVVGTNEKGVEMVRSQLMIH